MARFADGIVALDDGSTDDTRSILRSNPLVLDLLTNEPRPDADGWDDGANRRRLLDAAKALAPTWVLFLDVDERIPSEDAQLLDYALDGDLIPGCAYGFQHFRMWGRDGCDPATTWIYRLFALETEHTLPPLAFHFNPVPVQIPSVLWIRTGLRIQHFGASSTSEIGERRRKYDLVDPRRSFGDGFGGLDAIPSAVVPWTSRRKDAPLLWPRS